MFRLCKQQKNSMPQVAREPEEAIFIILPSASIIHNGSMGLKVFQIGKITIQVNII